MTEELNRTGVDPFLYRKNFDSQHFSTTLLTARSTAVL